MAEFITEEGKEALGKFAKYDAVFEELAKLLIPHLVLAPDFVESVAKAVADEVTSRVGKQIKADLTELDDERISEIVRSEIDTYDFIDEDKAREIADEQIAEIDYDDYRFSDAVKDAIRNMNFVVEIDRATVEVQ